MRVLPVRQPARFKIASDAPNVSGICENRPQRVYVTGGRGALKTFAQLSLRIKCRHEQDWWAGIWNSLGQKHKMQMEWGDCTVRMLIWAHLEIGFGCSHDGPFWEYIARRLLIDCSCNCDPQFDDGDGTCDD
jgi:hypothetical protein